MEDQVNQIKGSSEGRVQLEMLCIHYCEDHLKTVDHNKIKSYAVRGYKYAQSAFFWL